MTSPTRLDPVTFEVILHRLFDIAEEMGIKYMRTSGSPILVGGYDASTGITLANGELVATGPYISTQANVLPRIIDAVRTRCAANPGIEPGDMFICNDPYLGATHLPDVATVAPVFHDGVLVAWVGASGHWPDIGGPEPGSINMNARTIYEEGLRLPPTKIVEAGRIREDIVGLVMNQVRDPLVELDLRGQVVANLTGTERMAEVFATHGADTALAAMTGAIAFVERRVRARLRRLPDGVWREVQYIDHDGHGRRILPLVCTATKRGERLRLDFAGTHPQAAGYVNCSEAGLRAAAIAAMYILLAYDLPWNDGVARCMELTVPPGTVLSAVEPAPVSMSTMSSIILSLGVVFSALSKMLGTSTAYRDEAMANWCATSVAPGIMGRNESGFFTYLSETSHFGAGCGARTYADGVDTGGIIINTTASMPSIETTEAEFPVLFLSRSQIIDSGGPGRFRGGLAGGLALTPYDASGPLESSFSGCGAEVPNAFGLAGGLPGAAVRYLRFEGTSIRRLLRDGQRLPAGIGEFDGRREATFVNRSHAPFSEDAIEFHSWQGGGGYGDPIEREPERVLRDMRDRVVSADAALSLYGVVLAGETVDLAATAAAREALRAGRLARGRPAVEALGPGELLDGTEWIDETIASGIARYA
ncbi:MAG: hydantoinase B/oxoprolinase family protein, partial [Longimicrobiales bacterium]